MKNNHINSISEFYPSLSADKSRASVHGVYSVEDLIRAEFQYDRYQKGRRSLETESNWLTDSKFDFSAWVEGISDNFYFDSAESAIIVEEPGIMQVYETRGKLTVRISGDPQWCRTQHQYFSENFKKAESLVKWVYNQKGEEIQIPLNYRKGINAAYPWFEGGYEAFIDAYLDSEASILILIGNPGTGKCLDPDEEIELLVSDEIYNALKST